MPRPKASQPGPKAPRPPVEPPATPRVRRRKKSAHAAVRKAATLVEFTAKPREIPGVMKRKFEKR
jgi:hypothetical protein